MLSRRRAILFWGIAVVCHGPVPLPAAALKEGTRQALLTLKAECFSCHNDDKKKGGLVLTTRERLLEGGDNGAVVVPGKPDSSRLAKALAREADPHMPPRKQLTEAQVKTIRAWIKSGLAWDAAVLTEEAPVSPVALLPLPPGYQPVLTLALSQDGARLAVGRGGSIVIHDATATNFPVLAQWEAQPDAVQSLAWSADGRRLASGAFRRVTLWSADTWKREREWTNGLAGRVAAAMFFPGGDRLAIADGVAAQGGFVRILTPAQDAFVTSWRAHEDAIMGLDISRDGTQLVTAGGDKLIKIWDLETKKELARLEGHAAAVLGVAFNTNATQVVSAGADRQLRVWDVATRHPTSTLGKHAAAVTATAWPGTGAVVVATTDGGAVVTYKNLKAHTGSENSAAGDERKISEGTDVWLCLAVTADGKRVFAGSHDGVVCGWSGEGKLFVSLDPPERTSAGAPPPISKSAVLAPRAVNPPAGREREIGEVISLTIEPGEIFLSPGVTSHGILVSARTADGFEADVTRAAKFSASRGAPFEVTRGGEIHPLRTGDGVLTVQFRGKRAQAPVRVGAMSANTPVSFVRDVLPVLSKAGCNAGPCHAKPEGQNGFKLSVFSYDPQADYAEIVKENRGRRIFPAAPDESLILRKPTGAMPHEGGVRFERGSETHRLLVRWLREGMTYSLTNEPSLQRLVAFPKERRYAKGSRQGLLVEAHYSDGSVRDVTDLASFDSNDKEIARVDDRGTLTVGTLTGQGVIVARYMGFVADSQVLVPADRLLPEARYATLPTNNFIDVMAYAQFQRLGLYPSEPCTDTEFHRRASLDAIGTLPTAEEVREFLDAVAAEEAAGGPRGQARRALIDRLLARPEFADYWAYQWADLLRPNPDRVGVKSVFLFDQWLRGTFRENKPYDQFVREILLAEGSTHRDGPTVIYRDRREPADLTTMFSQLFLGTRLECARCHHHPNEKWSQDDFYEFAAFFGPVKQKGAGLSPPISGGSETFRFEPGGKVKHPVTGAIMSPRPPDGPRPSTAADTDPRRALADWLTAPDNPFFARAAVNRIWAAFFGRGLVEPVDDFRISNPCVNPPLLDALARDFVQHGWDVKHVMRTIMQSRLYQLSSAPNETNLADTRNFSRAYRRRLSAEVLLDAVNRVTGIPDHFDALPAGSRAVQAWTYKVESQLLDAFSRPNPSSDPPCERDRQTSVVQALHLMNSKALQSKLKSGRARELADSARAPEVIVTELYLHTLSRPPTEPELKLAAAAFTSKDATRQTATEDVLWSLLNSAEFVFNH